MAQNGSEPGTLTTEMFRYCQAVKGAWLEREQAFRPLHGDHDAESEHRRPHDAECGDAREKLGYDLRVAAFLPKEQPHEEVQRDRNDQERQREAEHPEHTDRFVFRLRKIGAEQSSRGHGRGEAQITRHIHNGCCVH
jgi:hypothetical protein